MKSKMPVQIIFREYFEGILAAVFLAVFLRFFVFSVFHLPETNMEPGLLKGDFVVSWKLAYGLHVPLSDGVILNKKAPKRGDVVAFRFPGNQDQVLIRRVVGLPGEEVQIKKGEIWVDGAAATYASEDEGGTEAWPGGESYKILQDPTLNLESTKVPDEHYFVLTDNRSSRDDSSSWGAVPFDHIESRLAFTWLSLDSKDGALSVRWPRIFNTVR